MIDVEKEKARLTNEMAKTKNDIARSETLLAGEFSKRAPKEVVQKTRDSLAANQERAARLDGQLASLEGRRVEQTKPGSTKPAKKRKTVKSKGVTKRRSMPPKLKRPTRASRK